MKLLLHMCCGPCTTYPLMVLRKENVEIEGLFYNPNIHPIEEYELRKKNVELFANTSNFKVNYMDDFFQDKWESFNGEKLDRCKMCYSIRLNKVAEYAKDNGFDAFTTTLLVSPYQNHDLIKVLGENIAKHYGLIFYYQDFRDGFREGQQIAKHLGLYRQKYCGCIVSYNESEILRKKKTL